MLIPALILVFLLAFYLNAFIKKNAVLCYIICTALAALGVYISWSGQLKHFSEIGKNLAYLLIKGQLSMAMFIFVMWAPLFDGSLKSKLMRIRGELSIMASLLIFGHNIGYAKTYFVLLISDPSRLEIHSLCAAIISLILIAILIPLFITSFKCVRKTMSSKTWKRIQRLAYVFYALIPFHVGFIWAKELKAGNLLNIVLLELYALIFVAYAFIRIEKHLSSKKYSHPSLKAFVIAVVFSLAIRLCGFVLPLPANTQAAESKASIANEEVISNQEAKAVEEENLKLLEGEYQDGEYFAYAEGYNGDVGIRIQVKDNRVVDFTLEDHEEDEPYIYWAFNGISKQFLENQSAEQLDDVSQATTSSHAIQEAVAKALEKAKKAN